MQIRNLAPRLPLTLSPKVLPTMYRQTAILQGGNTLGGGD
jgi:hypothetical protein